MFSIRESLEDETLERVEDSRRLHAKLLRNGLDLQQVHHAHSAADLALWDIVGKHLGQPIYKLLDGPTAVSHPKLPYASVLFGETPEATREKASEIRRAGFTAAKFGWGPMGKLGRENDIALVRAAREGMGEDATVLVDAGVVWREDDATVFERAADFAPFRIGWLEEPFLGDAIEAYRRLRERKPAVPIAAGEASGRFRDAEDLIQNGGVDFVQIDVGRIGGITPAHRVRTLAEQRGVTYVNHTFKSHLSLAASIHVFAAVERFRLLEYCVGGSPLATDLVNERLERGPDGLVRAPERPGLGVTINLATVKKYLHPVKIELAAKTIFRQPAP